jgi:hypothetical protein
MNIYDPIKQDCKWHHLIFQRLIHNSHNSTCGQCSTSGALRGLQADLNGTNVKAVAGSKNCDHCGLMKETISITKYNHTASHFFTWIWITPKNKKKK